MNEKSFTCIICPRGCHIVVDQDFNVYGNNCDRGKEYALSEINHPVRTLTTSVRVKNRKNILVSVKSNNPVPKEKLFDLMKIINKISICAPVKIGDIVVHNPLGLSIDIIVTKNID